MNPLWRQWLIIAGCSLIAVWLGLELADGSYGLPMAAGVIALSAILVRTMRVPLDAIAVGLLLIGFMVGNRGFAQLMPLPNLPLLPAELVLMVAGGWLVVESAYAKTLPWRRDPLNRVLVAWFVVGSARALFDVPRFGFIAVRDYAMIYYVAFFFIAQRLAREERARRFLVHCLLAASVSLPVVFLLFAEFPLFFVGTFTVRNVPLVYFKGDLVATFMAVAAVAIFHTVSDRHRLWAWPLATAMMLWVFAGDNRASMLGAVVMLGWLALSRHRVFPAVQALAAVLALAALIGVTTLTENPWADKKLHGLADRAMSIVDVTGQFTYRSEESFSKGANNRFRWVWWRTVAEETVAKNPVFGLGFGYDLARGFLQEYNPDLAEEFTARSPHSILVSALGRLGLVGAVILLWFVAILAARTWRVVRDPATEPVMLGLWASAWAILVSACFGVVLEGPMGAVVFWSLLGLAHGSTPALDAAATVDSAPSGLESDHAVARPDAIVPSPHPD